MPRKDGFKARCAGPGICVQCNIELRGHESEEARKESTAMEIQILRNRAEREMVELEKYAAIDLLKKHGIIPWNFQPSEHVLLLQEKQNAASKR